MESKDYKEAIIKLQSVIDTAIDGIITIDSKGLIESINPAGASIFDYPAESLIGKNIKMLMPDPYHSEHDGYLKRYLKTKKPHIIGVGREVKGKKIDGSVFPFRLAVSEVILNDRIIFTGIVHDLTDIKNSEKKLLEVNESLEAKVKDRTNELETVINKLLDTNNQLQTREDQLQKALNKEKELNELKSRFVSLASHEFRTPLSTIASSASLIGKYPQEEQQSKREKHIDRIKAAVNNLTGILNDFLSLSKIEEGKIHVTLTEVALIDIITEVVEEVDGIKSENQTISIHGDNILLESDPRILKNIMFNLISNGIKYTEADGNIECKWTKIDDKNLQINVSDDGVGIPQEDQKHIFTRFFRASNVENVQGTGLGLAIVRRYVSMLGGIITFKSLESTGTTFTITLPIKA